MPAARHDRNVMPKFRGVLGQPCFVLGAPATLFLEVWSASLMNSLMLFASFSGVYQMKR